MMIFWLSACQRSTRSAQVAASVHMYIRLGPDERYPEDRKGGKTSRDYFIERSWEAGGSLFANCGQQRGTAGGIPPSEQRKEETGLDWMMIDDLEGPWLVCTEVLWFI